MQRPEKTNHILPSQTPFHLPDAPTTLNKSAPPSQSFCSFSTGILLDNFAGFLPSLSKCTTCNWLWLNNSEFLLLDPWEDPNKNQQGRNKNSPKLDIQHIYVIISLGGSTDRSQHKYKNDISTDPVPFIERFRLVHSPI